MSRGKRYSTAEKLKVIKFVQTYNAKHGRGGQSQAAKKFGLSQLTIASWLRSPHLQPPSGEQKKENIESSETTLKTKIRELLEVSDQLRKLEKETAKLREKYESLRKSILGDL